MRQSITGTCIAIHRRSYQPFTDRQTGETRPGGVTTNLWLSLDFEDAPQAFRVPGDLAEKLEDERLRFAPVEVSYEAQSSRNSNQVTYRALDVRLALEPDGDDPLPDPSGMEDFAPLATGA